MFVVIYVIDGIGGISKAFDTFSMILIGTNIFSFLALMIFNQIIRKDNKKAMVVLIGTVILDIFTIFVYSGPQDGLLLLFIPMYQLPIAGLTMFVSQFFREAEKDADDNEVIT